MPTVFYNRMEEMKSLCKEPYSTVTKKLKSFKSLDGQSITLRLGGGKEGFSDGFFSDDCYIRNSALTLMFADAGEGRTFVRAAYSFGSGESGMYYYQRHIGLLKQRVPYFYIPQVYNFEFSSNIDDEIELRFDVITDRESVSQVCCSLINQIIAIFSFED